MWPVIESLSKSIFNPLPYHLTALLEKVTNLILITLCKNLDKIVRKTNFELN